MPVTLQDLGDALEFVSAGGIGEHQAFLCRRSGKLYLRSDSLGDVDEWPGDIDDAENYVAIPDKRKLDLGKPLALDFVSQVLPATTMKSGRYSVERAPTPASRTC